MELLTLQMVLLVVAAMIGLSFTVFWTTAFYGVKIFLLIRKDRQERKEQKMKKKAT